MTKAAAIQTILALAATPLQGSNASGNKTPIRGQEIIKMPTISPIQLGMLNVGKPHVCHTDSQSQDQDE